MKQNTQPQGQPQQNSMAPSKSSDKTVVQEQKQKVDKSTTQKSLLFSEIRDNLMIMTDGSFRAVIECQSINFDLMSAKEKEGIEYSYQDFLNSLNFNVQILIRSQRVDIGPYLNKLSDQRRNQDNMLLGVLMDDYIGFIEVLSEEANIMDKRFYIAVEYGIVDATKIVEKSKGFFSSLMGGSKEVVTKIDSEVYEKSKTELRNRVDLVINGLFQIGVHCKQLDTRQLSELYYNIYNPDTAVREPIPTKENLHALYIKKGTNPTQPTQGGI